MTASPAMQTLSSTLMAAQRGASAAPYVQVALEDRLGGVARLAWEQLYAGSEEDHFHAGALSGGAALLRARTNPTDDHLYYQRVASPGPGSDYATWEDFGSVSAVSGLALAAQESAVLLFSVAVNQRNVMFRESADDGASYGSPQLIHDPGAITYWLAADFSPSGVAALFFAAGSTIYWTKRSGGSWSTPQAWPHSLNSVTGLACRYLDGDWCLIVCGEDMDGVFGAWTCVFGDGGAEPVESWSPLREVIGASAGANVVYRTPSLARPDLLRAFLVEKYSGTSAYSRPLRTHSTPLATFSDNLWREPAPLDLSLEHGPALQFDASYAWMTTPAGVWRAPLAPAGADVSADLLEMEMLEGPDRGRLRLILENADGLYDPGVTAAVRLGAEASVSLGYRTSMGVETAPMAHRFWVASYQREVRQGRRVAVLEAINGWGLLAASRTRRQRTWAAGQATIYQVLSAVFTAAGLETALVSGSSLLQTLTPAFTLLPGEALDMAVSRLLALAPDAVRFSGSVGEVLYPQATDPADYTYGADHPLLASADRQDLAEVNRVQVYGEGVLGEAFLWDEIDRGADWLLQVVDKNLTTAAQASERAEAELRRRAVLTPRAHVEVPVNCGQELFDVVEITSAPLGWTDQAFRVVGIGTRYRRQGHDGVYRQRMELGGV